MENRDIRTPVPTIYGDFVTRFKAAWEEQVQALKAKFGDKIEDVKMPPDFATDVPIVYVKKDAIVDVLRFLKDDPALDYNFLSDITATDENPARPRFEVVYQLLSHRTFARLRVKARVGEGEEIPTVTSVWPAANWAEREVFDMFGVRFKGHPDLRRILMDERWQGHPLRKDYPLKGYQIFSTPAPVNEALLNGDGQ